LLLSTALASTLLLATLSAPTPARALTNCLTGNPPPGPITTTVAGDIICVNVDNRFNAGAVIALHTTGGNNYINAYNSGTLNGARAAYVDGFRSFTDDGFSPISMVNLGSITATSTANFVDGLLAFTNDGNSPISIVNSAEITATAFSFAAGLIAFTNDGNSPISIVNSGNIKSTSTAILAMAFRRSPMTATARSAS
jgi:hypothetical protein